MSNFFDELTAQLEGRNRTIVFPEPLDERILTAASQLVKNNVLTPILIGSKTEIMERAKALDIDITTCQIIDPETYDHFDRMVEKFVERRAGKATEEEARKILKEGNYFGTMLVYMNEADGLVCGAVYSTADTVRPALQIIKTKPGLKRVHGIFLMVREDERYIFGDSAININPSSEDLAEIATESAKTGELFGIDPRVAMLSFSTKGSAKSPETEKVVEALQLAKEAEPELVIDGEFQFDTAIVPSVAQQKAPDSPVQGNANIFIFPNLDAGNIGYKMAERLGGFEALGPILQGVNKPVNDLSRGCTTEDVYKLAIITAIQAK